MGKLGYDNDHEFTLDSEEFGSIVVQDPLNWETDSKSFEYDSLGGGTLRKVNTSLEFAGNEAHNFIRMHGFDSNIQVTKRIKDPYKIGEDWRIGYQANLDLTKAEYDLSRSTKVVKAPFTQGGLYDKIKAAYSDTFDLVNTKDANGNDIGELSTIIEQVQGREIYRRSVGEVEDGTRIHHPVSNGDHDVARAVIFEITTNSDSDNINSIIKGSEFVPFNNGNYASGQVGALLFTKSDRTRTRNVKGKIKVNFYDNDLGTLTLDRVYYTYFPETQSYAYWKKEEITVVSASTATLEVDINDTITLDENKAMTYVLHSDTDDGMGYEYESTSITIIEDDSYQATEAKVLLPYEMFDRLLTKIIGESGLLKTKLFGRTDLGYNENGQFSHLAVSSGFWSRGFDLGDVKYDDNGDEIPPKQFTISLKDAFESFYTVCPLMWGIQNINGKEYFILEHYEHTQQDFVGVRMGRLIGDKFTHITANNPKETPLPKNLFTSVKIGYEKGGSEYEEVSGLSAPHGLAEYSTSLELSDANPYSKTSKIRADVEGYDLARRKQSVYFPDTDTTYDQDLFFRHLKKVGGQYFLKTWQDDFENAPNNVYSPDTTGNLLLTPFRCLLRHGKIIATGLYKKPYSKLVWISSNCNSDIATTTTGETELAENGSIENRELGTPYINGYLLKFDGKVYQSMIDELEGFTEINGEQIPNWYGRFEVMYQGTLQYGRLAKSDITGEGKHEIALI